MIVEVGNTKIKYERAEQFAALDTSRTDTAAVELAVKFDEVYGSTVATELEKEPSAAKRPYPNVQRRTTKGGPDRFYATCKHPHKRIKKEIALGTFASAKAARLAVHIFQKWDPDAS